MLKKCLSVIITLSLFVLPFNTLSVNARESTNITEETEVRHIFAEDNIQLSDDAYLVRYENLVGTSLANKQVIVTNDGVYVDGVKSLESVAIRIGKKLIGYFIDGAIQYVTGYSGGQLAAIAIRAIASLISAHPGGAIIVAVMLLTLTSDTVQSYKTSTGNECVLDKSGRRYICKYTA